jgi:glutamate formiminotransferase/glutamate formiminotransferase/formiminotetrahydrofolate cyclodeaminase
LITRDELKPEGRVIPSGFFVSVAGETRAMPPILECIPNFSEGRNPAVLNALMTAVTSVPQVWLLHHTMDADHHRSVLTFAGPPDAVGEAAYRVTKAATALIDLRRHDGRHPRIGATDVVPFVPVGDVSMDECVRVARTFGQKVGVDLGIPVFLYEQAATDPTRAQLENIRRGGLSGLAARMESDPAWTPDFGPVRIHETAGAMVTGARQPLIAFNVNLNTTDPTVARSIAKSVRQSNGGLPCLKAMGVELPSRAMTQVSMNLTDYRITSLHAAFQAVKTEAAKHGVEVAGSEVIGLVPQAALDQTAAAALHLAPCDSTRVLEARLRDAMADDPARGWSLSEFLERVADAKSTPAGGSAAALVGALAAALGAMGTRVSGQNELRQQLVQSSLQLQGLIRADTEAYQAALRSRTIPDERSERSGSSAEAWRRATEIPLEIAEVACQVGWMMQSCVSRVKSVVRSDVMVGLTMALAAAEAGLQTAQVNVKLEANQGLTELLLPRIRKAQHRLEELKALCYTPPPNR